MTIRNHIDPRCKVFETCGGCAYQNISYSDELNLKRDILKELLEDSLSVDYHMQEVVPSPREYHYRHRLDLKLKKTKTGDVFVGFTPVTGRGVVEIDECPIAMEAVSDFIPQLKEKACQKLTPKYRQANLVVRTGDDGRVYWGGIGKRSLRMRENEYLWTELNGRKIFYALETFFQANLSILPKLFENIIQLNLFDKNATFLDLYGGVGLFGLGLIDHVRRVVLIENCKPSVALARYNVQFHGLDNMDVVEGSVEEHLPEVMDQYNGDNIIAMIDPPRAGLSEDSLNFLVKQKRIGIMLYLSCNPQALARDLKGFVDHQWSIEKTIPFDFFPKTKHLETLVVLKNNK